MLYKNEKAIRLSWKLRWKFI